MHHVAVYTEQWLGYISSLFGGFSLCYCSVEVCSDACSMRKAYDFLDNKRLWVYHFDSSTIIRITSWMSLTSLQNTVCVFLFSSGSLLNIGMVFWQVFVSDRIRTEENKWIKNLKYNLISEPDQTSIRGKRRKKRKGVKLIKHYLLICQNLEPFSFNLSRFSAAYTCSTLCIGSDHLYPCGSPFVPFTWRHLQWGHIYRTPTLAVHNPPEPKQMSVSKWAMVLIFLSFFHSFLLPDEGWSPQNRYLDTPALRSVTEYYTLSATWNKT